MISDEQHSVEATNMAHVKDYQGGSKSISWALLDLIMEVSPFLQEVEFPGSMIIQPWQCYNIICIINMWTDANFLEFGKFGSIYRISRETTSAVSTLDPSSPTMI